MCCEAGAGRGGGEVFYRRGVGVLVEGAIGRGKHLNSDWHDMILNHVKD